VLTLTESAVTEIRNLLAMPEVPNASGMRITSEDDGALVLALSGGPAEGDAVIDEQGVRVFLDSQAGELLDDKTLDAAIDPDGYLQFSIEAPRLFESR
jgi:Fe-S cluster assembly iron-binding protein IscA